MPPVTPTLEVAGADRLVGEADRAHARGADLVDRLRGDLLRDAGLDLGLARGDLPLAGLQHLAVDDLLDLVRLDLGALERRGDRVAAEVGRVERGEPAAHLPERGAGGGEDHGLRHRRLSSRAPIGRPVQAGIDSRSARAVPPVYARAPVQVEVADKPLAEVEADLRRRPPVRGRRAAASRWRAPRRRATPRAASRSRAAPSRERPSGCWWSGSASARTSTPERARVGGGAGREAGAAPGGDARLALAGPGRRRRRPTVAAALVEGAILASYRFDRFKRETGDEEGERRATPSIGESLTLLGDAGSAEAAEAARVAAEAANRARELQNLPSNVATPTYLAERAEELAAEHETPVASRCSAAKEIVAQGDGRARGGLAGHRRGAAADRAPLRGRRRGRDARPGRQGRSPSTPAASRSSPPQGMQEMKMDMSGGAAVLEAVGAIAELELPIDLIAVDPLDREHAERPRDQARRHHHPAQRQDRRGQQHRRRGPADPRRRARLLRSSSAPTGSSTWPP